MRRGTKTEDDETFREDLPSPRKPQRRRRWPRLAVASVVVMCGMLVFSEEATPRRQEAQVTPRRLRTEEVSPVQEEEEPILRAEVGVVVLVDPSEESYVGEWIEYHILLGVRRFWIVACQEMQAFRPYIEAGIATVMCEDLEVIYDKSVDLVQWLAMLHVTEYIVSPLRLDSVVDSIGKISTNPLSASIQDEVFSQLSSQSFAAKIAALGTDGVLRSNKTLAFDIHGRSILEDAVATRWAPGIGDVLGSFDNGHAAGEWAGIAVPVLLFGDSGHRTPLSGLSVFSTYTRRADPVRARNWRARSFTSFINADGCEAIRPDPQSSVHVCRRVRAGWPSAKMRTSLGDLLSPAHPIIPDDVRERLDLQSLPSVARYTRSATEYASAHADDPDLSPPREFGHLLDDSILKALETRLEALAVARDLLGVVNGPFSSLVTLLLGENYLTKVLTPSPWLVRALSDGLSRENNATCLACDLITAVGDGWERGLLLFQPDDAPSTGDDLTSSPPSDDASSGSSSSSSSSDKKKKKKKPFESIDVEAAKLEEKDILESLRSDNIPSNQDDLLG